jgi:hypothetical protein
VDTVDEQSPAGGSPAPPSTATRGRTASGRPGRRHPAPDRPAPLRGRPLFRSWLGVVTAAELAGFAVPAVAGALTADRPAVVMLPALLAAGAVEGALLGGGQALVLRRALPGLPVRRWVGLTAAAAVLAYLLGLAPSMSADVWSGWPPALAIALAVPLGVALLLSIGTAQWIVLRRLVPRAGRWIIATAVGWLSGLAVFMAVTMPLWQPGQPIAVTVAIGLAGGALMAATMAGITGWALLRLLSTRS